ncbi:MAG: RNA-directed DNA polymerase [Cytophagaceae bacterium]|nr:MAG: RNA-directed DNA polymerase [Cytophagaceae bacterium]
MSLFLRKPSYPCKPINSLRSLAAALRVTEDELLSVANIADTLYRKVKLKPGSDRQTFDATPRLKRLHARIKSVILAKVIFPDYLTGSLKGRDYKTNASLHINKSVLITEDVKGFFGSVSDVRVNDVWRHFFRFDASVAETLTLLTTRRGALPQGAISSSYLANLAMWSDEPLLHAKLAARGIIYSRYVDDMCMSSNTPLSIAEKTRTIEDVYGMLMKNGLSARRDKHDITPATGRMLVTKLVVNRKPALPPEQRSRIRAMVFQAEQMARNEADPKLSIAALNKAANKVGQLGRFHCNLSKPLKARLALARAPLPHPLAEPRFTGPDTGSTGDAPGVPWE